MAGETKYPAKIDSPNPAATGNFEYNADFVTNQDNTDTNFADDVNSAYSAIIAIETELGPNPKGVAADVGTRIGNVENALTTHKTSTDHDGHTDARYYTIDEVRVPVGTWFIEEVTNAVAGEPGPNSFTAATRPAVRMGLGYFKNGTLNDNTIPTNTIRRYAIRAYSASNQNIDLSVTATGNAAIYLDGTKVWGGQGYTGSPAYTVTLAVTQGYHTVEVYLQRLAGSGSIQIGDPATFNFLSKFGTTVGIQAGIDAMGVGKVDTTAFNAHDHSAVNTTKVTDAGLASGVATADTINTLVKRDAQSVITAKQFQSTVNDVNIAPFVVNSPKMVIGLNVEMVGGKKVNELGATVSSVAPATPAQGIWWLDTSTTPKMKYWTGSTWQSASGVDYAPVNKAGDTVTGDLAVNGNTTFGDDKVADTHTVTARPIMPMLAYLWAKDGTGGSTEADAGTAAGTARIATAAVTISSATTDLYFGKYGVAFRIKSALSGGSTSLGTISVTNGATTLASLSLSSADFTNTTDYHMFYLSFDHKTAGTPQYKVTTLTTNKISVDYFAVAPAMPAVYVS